MSRVRRRKSAAPVVTRAEFNALSARLEDIEDAMALRAAAAQFDERDALPIAMVKRIQAGEHPLRIWRERRGLTLSALAKRADVQPGYLSEIEAGKKPGSVDAYRRAARALGVDIDDLVPTEASRRAAAAHRTRRSIKSGAL
jgi:hypothetical protein